MSRSFLFDLYRLNIEDVVGLFVPPNVDRIRSDSDIRRVLSNAVAAEFDINQLTRKAVFRWSIRDFADFSEEPRQMLHIVLARSVLEREGAIVTDDGMKQGTSSSSPPLASTVVCFFDLKRHLVAIERNADFPEKVRNTHLEEIISRAAQGLLMASRLQLEPIPEKNGILGLFKSFDRITRMRLTLRIPNPELNRYTRELYADLAKGEIREITQDMKNPNGLSKSEDARPFASAVLAEQGYKRGDVQFQGIRDGEFEVARSGSTAARGNIASLRDFVRGLGANARAKETQSALAAVSAEIDRIHPVMKDND